MIDTSSGDPLAGTTTPRTRNLAVARVRGVNFAIFNKG